MEIEKTTAKTLSNRIGIVLEEYRNCLLAADDMVTLRLRQKIQSDLNSKNDMLQTLENNS